MSAIHLAEPLTFAPYFRPQVWGGRRLADVVDKDLPPGVAVGEAWEISVQPRHVSVVDSGHWKGKTLDQIWHAGRIELAGPAAENLPAFPWLIKWLDCHDVLSVQVHPDDAMAQKLLGEPFGKTESWVIVHAEPTAKIYAGWKAGVTRAELKARIADGTIAEAMHSFTPEVGQVIHIPAGTVHALGGGVVVAEIQQTSDATFRLFDWNRVDDQGNSRPLHVEQALESLNFDQGPVEPMTPHAGREMLVRCPYYALERIVLKDSLIIRQTGMSVMMVLSGEVQIEIQGGQRYRYARGRTILLPATLKDATLSSVSDHAATVLRVTLPND